MNRKDPVKNELSYGKYGNVSKLEVGYWESMSRLENFMQKRCSMECTLNVRLHVYGIVL